MANAHKVSFKTKTTSCVRERDSMCVCVCFYERGGGRRDAGGVFSGIVLKQLLLDKIVKLNIFLTNDYSRISIQILHPSYSIVNKM